MAAFFVSAPVSSVPASFRIGFVLPIRVSSGNLTIWLSVIQLLFIGVSPRPVRL
jgi:hypothetical protein